MNFLYKLKFLFVARYLTVSLRGPVLTLRRGRQPALDGLDGWDSDQKCPLNLFILFGDIDYVCILIPIQNKNCHQHSYGFQNFMSSWGSCSKISKLQQVGDFSFFGSKRSLLVSKISFNFLHTLWVYRLCICLLIYEIKIVTNILMGFKISCQVGGRGQKFQNYSR